MSGPYETRTSDYKLRPRPSSGFPLPVEMWGHVVRPVDAPGRRPLVLFLHGRHQACYTPRDGSADGPSPLQWLCGPRGLPVPSYLGYDYVQRLLASQGYVTVSISANSINEQDWNRADGGAAARSLLVRRHLGVWAQRNRDPESRWFHRLQMRNVVLVGHSRGGEGVERAAIDTATPAAYKLSGLVLIGPTDFGRQVATGIPTVSMLPFCDGDVSDLQGQGYVDTQRDVTHDPALHSALMVMGANHNFFNTEWTPGLSIGGAWDDWWNPNDPVCGRNSERRLTKVEQRRVGKTYIAGAVSLFARGDDSLLPMFDGSNVSVPSAGDADVRSAQLGLDETLIRPLARSLTGSGGAEVSQCVGRSSAPEDRACGDGASPVRTPHWPPVPPRSAPSAGAMEMTWSTAGATGGVQLAAPRDLSGYADLEARVVVAKERPVRLRFRLTDADATTATVPAVGGGRLVPFPGNRFDLAKLWGQNLRAPLAGVSGIDLTRVTKVELEGVSESGHVWLLEFAGRNRVIVPDEPTPLPVVSIGTARQVEGDGGTATLDVPYTVTGDVTKPASLRVYVQNIQNWRETQSVRVDIPRGTRSGVIPVAYDADRRYDGKHTRYFLAAFPLRNVMTSRYLGNAFVVDDDPKPRMTLSTVRARTAEGDPARFRLELSRPADVPFAIFMRFAAADRGVPQATLGDLNRRWVRSFTREPLSTRLSRSRWSRFGWLDAGRTSLELRVPVRRDGRAEGLEYVGMRWRISPVAVRGEPEVRRASQLIRD
ncbi:MAG: hypothetical protein GEU93_08445 [Propionibacteriales bacterium]|nr:hypothetical protein [Propionibacteriales bacterium]